MVQNVERLGSKLKIHTFFNRCILRKRKVEVLEARPDDSVPAGITEPARVTNKGRFVEEQIWSSVIQLDSLTGKEIGPSEREQTSAAVGQQGNNRAEWTPRLQIQDRRHAPAADQAVEAGLLRSEGQKISSTEHESLSRIEVRDSALRVEVSIILHLRIRTSHGIEVDGLRESVRAREHEAFCQPAIHAYP